MPKWLRRVFSTSSGAVCEQPEETVTMLSLRARQDLSDSKRIVIAVAFGTVPKLFERRE